MKVIYTLLIAGMLVFQNSFILDDSLFAADKSETVVTKETKKRSFLDRLWGKIRAISPKRSKGKMKGAVAGIKGAEKGSEELKPLWKRDASERAEAEKEAFLKGVELADETKFSEALIAFADFKKEFPSSGFGANAQFISAICHLSLDQSDKAINLLKVFVSDYPDHELNADAVELLASLK